MLQDPQFRKKKQHFGFHVFHVTVFIITHQLLGHLSPAFITKKLIGGNDGQVEAAPHRGSNKRSTLPNDLWI